MDVSKMDGEAVVEDERTKLYSKGNSFFWGSLVRATKGGSRTKLLGLFFEKRNIFVGVQTTASVRDETQLIFHGATDSEEGSEDLSKTKISLKNIFYELRRLKSSAR